MPKVRFSTDIQSISGKLCSKAQHKIGNPYNYMRSLVTDDLKVLLAGNELTGGVTTGGSTTEGGGTS